MVIDAIVEILTDGERSYDEDGAMAAAGSVHEQLVSKFLNDAYFRKEPPKTTGREKFGHHYARKFIERGRELGLSDEDVVASATALTARAIGDSYDDFADPMPDVVIVTGGGGENPTLMSMLREYVNAPIKHVDAYGIDGEAREAICWGLLAVSALDRVPNNVPTATGADHPVVMGEIIPP